MLSTNQDSDAPANEGVAIMAYVAPDQAAKLAVPNAEPPNALHVTLGYLNEQAADVSFASRMVLQAQLRELDYLFPLVGNAFARAEFNFDAQNERESCATLLVQSQALLDAHEAVEKILAMSYSVSSSTEFPLWIPHITLGYNLPITAITADKLGPVTFDSLKIGWGDNLVALF